MPRLVAALLSCAVFVAVVRAAPPRAVVRGDGPPAGVTVLDRRGDRWLVTGPESVLAALPGARLLGEARAAPARLFIPAPTPVIDDLVARVDAADLMADLAWLVSLGVRYSLSANIPAVADSLEARLASFGLATEQHLFGMGTMGTVIVPNVIATQTGRVHPDSVFVICAHYDATSEDARYDTPGADDNGSGTVAVLTAARLLSTKGVDYTVKYVLFAGEEQMMVGSDAWLAAMAAAGVPIVGALNFDMVAWWTAGVPDDLEIETNQASRWLADAVCYAADQFAGMPYELHVNDGAWWGDFASFWQYGYCAVNHEESYDWGDPDFNPWYHTTDDTPDKLSPEFFAGCVKTGVAALALVAGAADVSTVPTVPGGEAVLSAGPNPFNGPVVLTLVAAGRDGPCRVHLHDLRGRRVGEVTIELAGGHGTATWDARDAAGRALPAGVYLARAEDVRGRPICRVAYVP